MIHIDFGFPWWELLCLPAGAALAWAWDRFDRYRDDARRRKLYRAAAHDPASVQIVPLQDDEDNHIIRGGQDA